MNCSVKFFDTQDKNNEHRHVKCKYVVIVVWNILQEFKFHFYGFQETSLLDAHIKVSLEASLN
jgi:hypothetical protein